MQLDKLGHLGTTFNNKCSNCGYRFNFVSRLLSASPDDRNGATAFMSYKFDTRMKLDNPLLSRSRRFGDSREKAR